MLGKKKRKRLTVIMISLIFIHDFIQETQDGLIEETDHSLSCTREIST